MSERPIDLDTALASARAGDERGYSALYVALGGRVVEFLRARGAWDAEGLTNEVFLAVFHRLDSFEGDGDAFRGWVYTIARNKAIDDARRRAARPPLADGAEGSSAETAGGDTEVDVFVHLEREWIHQQLADLTDEQREVVLLRLVDDLSVREVAAIVGKPEDAVKALQHRALRQLRKKFANTPSPDEGGVR